MPREMFKKLKGNKKVKGKSVDMGKIKHKERKHPAATLIGFCRNKSLEGWLQR